MPDQSVVEDRAAAWQIAEEAVREDALRGAGGLIVARGAVNALLDAGFRQSPEHADPAVQLVQRLEQVTENVHAYLEERARELAEPYVAVAEKLANQRIAAAEHEAQRQQDLAAELRRQRDALERQAAGLRHELGRQHDAAVCPACGAARGSRA